MGNAFIVRRGGGGISWDSAILHIYAPAGSSVYVYKRGESGTTWPLPEHPVTGADSEYLYYVKAADYATYTVFATLNDKTAVETVNVTSNIEYIVHISYSIILFRSGVTSGFEDVPWAAYSGQTAGSVAISYDTYLHTYFATGGSTGAVTSVAFYSAPIDLTAYKTLSMTLDASSVISEHSSDWKRHFLGIFESKTPTRYTTDAVVKYTEINATGMTYTLDVTEYTGQYYIGMSLRKGITRNPTHLRISDFRVTG